MKEDPRDKLIRELNDENTRLRKKILKLEKELDDLCGDLGYYAANPPPQNPFTA